MVPQDRLSNYMYVVSPDRFYKDMVPQRFKKNMFLSNVSRSLGRDFQKSASEDRSESPRT